MSKRRLPAEFRLAKKDELDPLQVINCSGDEIVAMRRLAREGAEQKPGD